MEGKYDLTWGEDKLNEFPKLIQDRHEDVQLVAFGKSAHTPWRDEPDKF